MSPRGIEARRGGSGASGGQEAAKPPLSPSSSGRPLPAGPLFRESHASHGGARPVHVAGRLVVAKTEERRVTELAVARPLREAELRDERRLHPGHPALAR